MHRQNHTPIRLAIPLTLGMVGAFFCKGEIPTTTMFLLSCIALSITILLNIPKKNSPFGIAATILFLLIGTTLYTAKHHQTANGLPAHTTHCHGILTHPPIEQSRSWALNLKQDNGTHILLYVGKNQENRKRDSIIYSSLQPNDTIQAYITHLEPTANTDGEFANYKKHLFHQGICATAYVPAQKWLVRKSRYTTATPKSVQEKIHKIYERHGIQGETGSIIEAITIGRKDELSAEQRDMYAHAGISHILALSGFHISIIILIIQALSLKHLLPMRWQWLSNLVIVATLWCYTLLTGMSPSIVRATIMYTILLLSQSFSRSILSLNSCAIALSIMLCFNPFYLHDIGFRLSFTSVAAICLLSKRFIPFSTRQNKIIAFIRSTISITLICTLYTAPLVAYHFGSIPTLSIISNLVITPLVYILMFTCIFWWIFLWCPPVNTLLTNVLNRTAEVMNSIAESIASTSFSTIDWHPNAFITILCYIILFILTYYITKTKKT